jgi:hypothetical protein
MMALLVGFKKNAKVAGGPLSISAGFYTTLTNKVKTIVEKFCSGTPS